MRRLDTHSIWFAALAIHASATSVAVAQRPSFAGRWVAAPDTTTSGASPATGGREHRLKAGSIVLIERGTTHEIRNTGRTPLKTLNVYVPPAYRSDGNELPRGRS